MSVTVSINKPTHRADSTVLPICSFKLKTAEIFKAKLDNWNYFIAPSETFAFTPPNRSKKDCKMTIRALAFDVENWTVDANINIEPNGFSSYAESLKGVTYNYALDSNRTSIEARILNGKCGVSLQSDSVSHDYNNFSVKHAIVVDDGVLTIYEQGAIKFTEPFEYANTAFIELQDGFVRYYIVYPDTSMKLIRTTRSKLSANVRAEAMLASFDSEIDAVYSFNGDEGETTFENIGVATRDVDDLHWQKFDNVRQLVSTSRSLQKVNNEYEYTYSTIKRVIKELQLTPKSLSAMDFLAFDDFFTWHSNEREFLFVDLARKDVNNANQEFWARFTTPFTDSTRNSEIYEHGVGITETQRFDYVEQEIAVIHFAIKDDNKMVTNDADTHAATT